MSRVTVTKDKNYFIKKIEIVGHSTDEDICGALSILIQSVGGYLEDVDRLPNIMNIDFLTTTISLDLSSLSSFQSTALKTQYLMKYLTHILSQVVLNSPADDEYVEVKE